MERLNCNAAFLFPHILEQGSEFEGFLVVGNSNSEHDNPKNEYEPLLLCPGV